MYHFFYLSDSNALSFLFGNVFRENKDKLTVSHFIKVMEMQKYPTSGIVNFIVVSHFSVESFL